MLVRFQWDSNISEQSQPHIPLAVKAGIFLRIRLGLHGTDLTSNLPLSKMPLECLEVSKSENQFQIIDGS